MDTRFWGPSGWCLLHLVAANPKQGSPRAVKEWFELLEYVLPCKYCRASFHDYLKLQPLTMAIVTNRDAFSKWLYDIHNRVNGKLRDQELLTAEDPTWPSVRDKYYKMPCEGRPFVGWDFLTSIAYSTPAADYKPVPMSDTPTVTPTSLRAKNRYNLLTRQERLAKLCRWWSLIPSILPCPAWRSAWVNAVDHPVRVNAVDPVRVNAVDPVRVNAVDRQKVPLTAGKEAVMRWMWRIEEGVCANLKCPTPHPSLPALRHEVAAFESPCSGARKGKTCRTRKHRQRRLVLQRRQTRRV